MVYQWQTNLLKDLLPSLEMKKLTNYNVKESVFPFNKFDGVDLILGPEMKSTGEVMGSANTIGMAYAKSELAAGEGLPTSGFVFLSTNDRDKPALIPVAKKLIKLGFSLLATSGTSKYLEKFDCQIYFCNNL